MRLKPGETEAFISFHEESLCGFKVHMPTDPDIEIGVIVPENATFEYVAKEVLKNRLERLEYYKDGVDKTNSQIDKIEKWLKSRNIL